MFLFFVWAAYFLLLSYLTPGPTESSIVEIFRISIVVECTLICYRQHSAKRKAPVFKLLRSRFWGFLLCRGDTLHRLGWNLAWRRGSPPPCQISPHQCNDKGIGPQNWNFYWNLIKIWNINSPRGRIPCTISKKFGEFVPHFVMR